MIRLIQLLRKEASGSQIAEFAIGLPFLMVILVGIFDFGQAFNTKQHINTAAREAARFAANQSTLDWDLGASAPSIAATRNLVDSYLLNAKLNDCGLRSATPSFDAGTLTWTYSVASNCQGDAGHQLVVIIQRANTFPVNGTTVIGTKVTITYPLQWHFRSVMKVMLPGSNYAGPIFTITSDATMANLT
jgi:Flp pilus assembly protein TadG